MLKAVGGSSVKIDMTQLACFLMSAYEIIYCNHYNNFVMNYYIDTDWCHGNSTIFYLIHWGRVTYICGRKLTIIGWYNGLSPGRNIVNCTLGNKLQWNLNRNSCIFIQENAFENVVCKMAATLYRSLYVHTSFIATKSHNSFGGKQATLQEIHGAPNKICRRFRSVCLVSSFSSTPIVCFNPIWLYYWERSIFTIASMHHNDVTLVHGV